MLEGLIQTYLETLGHTWVPRCEPGPRVRDSQSRRTTLSSPKAIEGETRHVETNTYDRRARGRPFRLREC